MTMKKDNCTLIVPMVPNYIRSVEGKIFRVKDLSQDELREIGELWTKKLLEKNISQQNSVYFEDYMV